MTQGNQKPIKDSSPLTANQLGLFFLQQQHKDCFAYNIPVCLTIDTENLQSNLLRQACQAFVKQQPALATTFALVNGQPVQIMDVNQAIDFEISDQSALGKEQQRLNELLYEEANRPFDLEQDSVCRFRLYQIKENRYVFLMVVHHIIFDGYSSLLVEQIFKNYQRLAKNQLIVPNRLETSFKEFGKQQKIWINDEHAKEQLNFWQDELKSVSQLSLPMDHPLPAQQSFTGDSVPFNIDQQMADRLRELVKQQKITLSTLCLAVYKLLLYRHSNQTDLVIGMPVLGRDLKGLDSTVGYFVNMLPVRSEIDTTQPFSKFLTQLTAKVWTCLANRDYPFVKLVESLNVDRQIPRPPVFQASFAFQHFSSWDATGFTPMISGCERQFGDLHLTSSPLRCQEGVFELALEILWHDEGEIQGFLKYNSDLFERETIERMVTHYLKLLSSVVQSPNQQLGDIDYLSQDEQQQILHKFNNTYSEYPRELCIHQIFDQQASNTPDAIAVECDGKSLTYQQLQSKSRQLAIYLQSLGVKPDTLVAICANRSIEGLIGVLGILYAGGAYVPLDPDYPDDRINYMLEDSAADIILTHSTLQNKVAPLLNDQRHPIYLDVDWDMIELSVVNSQLKQEGSSNDLAYVIYTSGSTGRPKGVMVEHQAVNRLVLNTNYINIQPGDKVLHYASISFDAATLELYAPLLNGGTLVIPPQAKLSNQAFSDFVQQNGIDMLWLTSSLFQMLVKDNHHALTNVRTLLAGGEVVPLKAVEELFKHCPDIEFINGYGPTENTTFTCCYNVKGQLQDDLNSLPIGAPIANTQVYILDEQMRPVPVGIPGELHTSGDGLARGYLNAPDLTAEKFIDNPFVDDGNCTNPRLYKTGDLCRWLPDGTVEYIGRIDNQIKIRGFRVECGEIENALQTHEGVHNAIVIAKGEAANKQLMAFYTKPDHAHLVNSSQLSNHLAQSLPAHMIPSQFVLIDKLPLTPNGKVDKKQLLNMDIQAPVEQEYTAPRNDIEHQLVEIWKDVCDRQSIGIQDNFFDIGGNSILVMPLVQKINENLSINITINDVFTYPTIARLIDFIETKQPVVKLIPDPIPDDDHDGIEWQQQILVEFNQSRGLYPENDCIHTLFEQQAEQTPDNLAVIFEGQHLTYGELNEKATQLAIYLQSIGVKPDSLVAVCANRSVEMIIGILATLKAGGAYIPVDPQYPDERISYMLENGQTQIVLTQTELKPKISSLITEERHLICLNNHQYEQCAEGLSLTEHNNPSHLAYVIYTSGSTGKPKGVMIEHRSVVNFIYAFDAIKSLPLQANCSAWTAQGFDVSVYEVFTPLLFGGTLFPAPDEVRLDSHLFCSWLEKNNIHSAYIPAFFLKDYKRFIATCKSPMTRLLVGVEPIDQALLHQISELLDDAIIVNGYGPTEATVCTTLYPIDPYCHQSVNSKTPIGKPIANSKIYLLDDELKPVEIGEPGELHVAGVGLARGYYNSPDLTDDKFIDNPFATNKDRVSQRNLRLYKTGDLCKWLPDGNIEFVGRIDDQIKIRGFRIECGEIEACLRTHIGVQDAVVVPQEHAGNKRLIAFYTQPQEDSPIASNELNDHLNKSLPSHMIPAGYFPLDNLPLTPNGKVDRKFLIEKEVTLGGEAEYQAPTDDIEKKLVSIWQSVFHRQDVGIKDDFFDIGGDSLTIMSLVQKINNTLGLKLKIADIPIYSTIEKQSNLIKSQITTDVIKQHDHEVAHEAIAVIGMACRFPGADNIDEYWHNLKNGEESVRFFTDEELLNIGIDTKAPEHANYVPARGYVGNIKKFDAEFFGYSPKEAQTMDPQQRIFLEESYHAIEDAGYNPYIYKGKIGIYAGSGFNNYRSQLEAQWEQGKTAIDFQIMINNGPDFLASRVAYKLNLRGPAVVIQTACSTSLVAIKQACKAIKRGSCDMALAGGVSLPGGFEKNGYHYQQGMILSPDGRCRPFDSQAQGTVPAHGVGVVVLKTLNQALEDGDNIRAIIRSAAINNDGAVKVGYTAPSVEGQQRVIRQALKKAKVTADQISYVEAHGTATPLGDPIELQALRQAYQKDTGPDLTGYCAIGSVKSNIGHTDAAAGVASFIKTVLCLQNRTLVPTLHFNEANPALDLDNSPFFVNTETQHWPSDDNSPRIAGISAFGIGGTNAHVILEQAPLAEPTENTKQFHLLVNSAKTTTALEANEERINDYIAKHQTCLANACYTMQVSRNPMQYRSFLVIDENKDLEQQLAATSNMQQTADRTHVIFMFSGQGSQYINMCKDLYRHQAVFCNTMNACFNYLDNEMDIDLKAIIYPEIEEGSIEMEQAQEKLKQTQYTQVALFVVEYALAKLWLSFGITPHAMIGHSVGEYVAACVAGVIRLEDCLRLITRRGQMMQALPEGDMLAVDLSEQDIRPYLAYGNKVDIAVLNHPHRTVLAGTSEDIARVKVELDNNQVHNIVIPTSHAFHSSMMSPMLKEFSAELAKTPLHPPKINYISSMSGTWITKEQATDINYWCSQLRQTVRFWEGLDTLFKDQRSKGCQQLFLEAGPGQVLSSLTKQHPLREVDQLVVSTCRHGQQLGNDNQLFLTALGKLWQHGVDIDWAKLYGKEKRRRISLPGYAFEGKEYWIEEQTATLSPYQSNQAIQTDVHNCRVWDHVVSAGFKQVEKQESQSKTSKDRRYDNGSAIVRKLIGALTEKAPQQAALKIMEISDGHGDATEVILPLLPDTTCRYDFSCANKKQWPIAERRFGHYPYFSCKKLSISLAPQVQGYKKCRFDLVIAGTSIHNAPNIDDALKNLRCLLAPGGILLIWEFDRHKSIHDEGFANLVEYPSDTQYTQEHPFGQCKPWKEALQSRGFDQIEILSEAADNGYNILIARADSPAQAFTQEPISDVESEQDETNSNQQSLSSNNNGAANQIDQSDINQVSEMIKKVWQDYLGIDNVNEGDDFFARGGDSLIAVNVIAKLQEIFQLNLSFGTLLQYTTVQSLAELITNGQKSDRPVAPKAKESSLVTIQKGDKTKEPLFLVHPAGGQVYFYRDLAIALGEDQPIYGIQSLMNEDGTQTHVTIEEMAACYIKDLRREYPDKTSFILGGASLGGILANEMAHQLKPHNIEVKALIVSDAPGPDYMPELFSTTAQLLIYLANEKIDLQLEALEQMSVSQQIDYAKRMEERSEHTAIFPPHLSVDYLETLKAQNIAMHQYQFKTFVGDVIYFRHTEKMKIFPENMYRSWESLVHGELLVYQINGTHITMNMAPHVDEMATHLKPWLMRKMGE